jgi:hypothetical protein
MGLRNCHVLPKTSLMKSGTTVIYKYRSKYVLSSGCRIFTTMSAASAYLMRSVDTELFEFHKAVSVRHSLCLTAYRMCNVA